MHWASNKINQPINKICNIFVPGVIWSQLSTPTDSCLLSERKIEKDRHHCIYPPFKFQSQPQPLVIGCLPFNTWSPWAAGLSPSFYFLVNFFLSKVQHHGPLSGKCCYLLLTESEDAKPPMPKSPTIRHGTSYTTQRNTRACTATWTFSQHNDKCQDLVIIW